MPKSLISKASKFLPAKAPATQKKMLKELGSCISSEDVNQFDPELLADIASTHWSLAKKKGDGEPQIRIYCPITKTQKLRKTIIDVVSDDMAFLVDSIAAEINKNNLLIDLLVHPIFYVKYNKDGTLSDLSSKKKAGYTQRSHIHIHIKEIVSDEILSKLEKCLYIALDDVYYANRDWKQMLAHLKEARNHLSEANVRGPKAKLVDRYCSFLDYLHNNNFTLLGFREYEFLESKTGTRSKIIKGKSMGVLHNDVEPAYINENKEGLPRNLQELRRKLPPVSISKTNRLSTVHRRVPMDAIAVKVYDEKGKVIGERLFLGLFTSVTYSRSVSDVPLLREKVEDIMSMSDFLPNSHDRKALRHTLEKYPRDELFQLPSDELYEICLNILRLQERQHIALFVRRDPFQRYISCLVYIPRERFGTDLRKRIGNILENELSGSISSFSTSLDDSVFARVMFIINVSQKNPPQYNTQKIEKLLQEAGQSWSEKLAASLVEKNADEKQITSITLKYGEAFPVSYTMRYPSKRAVLDIKKIDTVLDEKRIALNLYKSDDLKTNQLNLKVYQVDKPITLSDIMPILEHMGLKAISEHPFEIKPAGSKHSVWLHDFLLERPSGKATEHFKDIKEQFEDCFHQVWYGNMESDALNKLVIRAGIGWQDITILRTYVRYIKQLRYPFGRLYVEKALNENPEISALIAKLFRAYLDPKQDQDPKPLLKEIKRKLSKVELLDQDRILRSILNLVEATLRTNFFQNKPYLSIKLDSKAIKDMPQPRPYREIFVYSPKVEGVHLRGDKIARGGLRWSDRHEDFRTEVLGLMKAQMVKNSVIVPMGSKGGFVVKTPTNTRDEFMTEGIECYKIFIRGLLDLTDNRKGKKIVAPENVICRDENDPYLVVAADKGTATFSDTANAISQEYGFWLDDAFASGGSAGYDHKKMGITARGGWESVKLHFRQLNHNTQTQAFDVIGVGDMGGDVFGNGMLLSEQIHLVGAFNHLHIFCDPDPDPASSFKERQRLFDAVAGWDQYDTNKLSSGGRIYSRSDKSLKLTPEIQKRFDIEKKEVSPDELMEAILGARTDLLWFGGIGTYIKSSDESNADAGDKANDNIRLDAKEIKAKVIGEGANLGVTQLGRIEFEKKGGRVNTDFLDNSAGVDSSDHEVNIKILLTEVMRDKKHKMNLKARNKLLEQMTDEIAEHVLRHNYQQAQAISLAEIQAPENLKEHESFIQSLERKSGLSREIEGLPNTEEIEARLRANKGLTRPELCIILAYSKIGFTQDLLASDVPDNPHMHEWLLSYFPDILQKKFEKEIFEHRLKREIIATFISNSMVNRMGPTFLQSCIKKTGADCSEIAAAYMLVRNIFNIHDLWVSIEELDNQVPAAVQLSAMKNISTLVEHNISWFLTRLGRPIDQDNDQKAFGDCISVLRKNMSKLLTPELKIMVKQQAEAGKRDGLPEKTAKNLALLPVLSSACDIIRISLEQKTDLLETARTYFEVGEAFHLDWLRNQARFMTSENRWYTEATEGLIDQLYSCQAGLTVHILKTTKAEKKSNDKQGIVRSWIDMHGNMSAQIEPLFNELRRAGTIDLPMLIIAEQRLRNLYGG